ncbi:response regulator [Methylocystis sp. WRRC1]|uniref:response regulator n=1 Tax=Methylocystis sp. WRRC1 TaxID=1732014 RepID=UPI001D15AEE0|nr:response regulator [Methylocystis sp. WRRC1]MCC3246378.1 response regulator [Methylocystis sp. WRRC1]
MQIGVEMARAMENKRVFIVDDDEIFRAALQFMLHDEYEAHEVASASLAIEKAKKQPPDLILLAESQIRKLGLGSVAELRAEMPGVKILVVIETADSRYGKECMGAGAHGFIAKPLKVEFVRQKVDAALGRGKGVTIPLTVLNTH